jgi:hypothetical protein
MIVSDGPSVEQNVAAVIRKAEEKLKGILNQSGTILYSSRATLTPGKYYFLGINPGGSAEGTSSIQNSLDDLKTQTDNAYIHQCWFRHEHCHDCKGKHPLQQNYQALFTALGEDLESVCASNLIFKRSRAEKDAGGWTAALECWPLHEEIIKIVQPRAIITFGKLPFAFIHHALEGVAVQVDRTKHGNWGWQRSTLNDGRKLIGLPHLSRYALRNDSEVRDQIKSYLGVA